jgi:hypothetical protein
LAVAWVSRDVKKEKEISDDMPLVSRVFEKQRDPLPGTRKRMPIIP